MSTLFKILKGFFYLAFGACLIALACFLFSGCRSAKINSSRQKSTEQASTQVEVKKQESTVATVATTMQEDLQKEGGNSWSIALSGDSDAVPFQFTFPDGSIVTGKGKMFSGAGTLKETRATSTQQQSTEQREATSDSTAKQETQKSQEVRDKQVERKASSLWPLLTIGLVAFVVSFLYFYFKPRKS